MEVEPNDEDQDRRFRRGALFRVGRNLL